MDIPKEELKQLAGRLEVPLVCYDLETSDKATGTAETLQFYALKLHPSGKTEELSFMVKPEGKIHPKASEVHGLYAKDLEKEKPFKHYAEKIVKFFKGCTLSGFNNIKFDKVIIDRQLKEAGFPDVMAEPQLDAYVIYLAQSRRKLGDAVLHYTGERLENAHDASYDVKGTLRVIGKQLLQENLTVSQMLNKEQEQKDDNGIDKYLEKDGDSWKFCFSKHKGKSIKSVEKSFLNWLVSKDFPRPFLDIIKAHL